MVVITTIAFFPLYTRLFPIPLQHMLLVFLGSSTVVFFRLETHAKLNHHYSLFFHAVFFAKLRLIRNPICHVWITDS